MRSYDDCCVFCDHSKLFTLYKVAEVHSRLLGTNGFHAKARNKGFTAAGSCCRQNLKYENFRSPFGRLRQKIALKSVIFPHSTNQIVDLWCCRCRCNFLNSLFYCGDCERRLFDPATIMVCFAHLVHLGRNGMIAKYRWCRVLF